MSSRQGWLRNRSLFIAPPPPKVKKKRLLRHIFLTAFKRLLMLFGFLFFVSFISTSIFVGQFMSAGGGVQDLPEEFVLSVTVRPEYVEYHNVDNFGFVPQPLTFRQVIDNLQQAQSDERVKALYARLEGGPRNLAQLQDLRKAIASFKESGKKTYIYAPSFSEAGGLRAYYLASVFDEIWMQPVGSLSLSGFGVEVPFVRETLEKIGVAPQFFARKEYKNVMESLERDNMSDASREMYEAMLADLSGQMLSVVSTSPTGQDIETLMAKGLFTDKEALAAGLITGLSGERSVMDLAQAEAGIAPDKPHKDVFYNLGFYAFQAKRTQTEGHAVPLGKDHDGKGAALVYLSGTILSEAQMGGHDSLSGNQRHSAEDIAKAIDQATEDEQLTTIIMRIDSPGGSPTASETIRQALVRARQQGMKVIASMGNVAASGGYWVASGADVIFASPATITGSIGVAGGKVHDAGLWERLGVNWERVEEDHNATMYSFNRAFTEDEEALINAQMDRIYEAFLERVAEGRGMTVDDVDEIARGRVWTGKQAQERGLVDQLGGLDETLDYAALEAGFKDRFEMPLKILPKPVSPFELFRDLFEGQGVTAAMSEIGAVWAAFRDVAQDARIMSSMPVSTYEAGRVK